MRDKVYILGVGIDNLTEGETLQRMEEFIESGTPHQVVTVNPEFLVVAQEDHQFKKVLDEADLAIPDGVGLLWAARLLGKPLKGRVTGVELVRSLAKLAEKRGYRIFLLGAREGVAQAAAKVLQDESPNLVIAGTYAGSPTLEEEGGIVERISAARPHMLFVAYGFPQQDVWIRRNMNRMSVPMSMGVGGAFDYISGTVKRAPAWMRRLGLEWLFRLVRQPWRWRRILRLPRFVWLVLRSAKPER